MNVVLIGRPGVGKGTQAARLAEALGWSVIATGEMLRAAFRTGDDDLRVVAERIAAGELASDELVMELVERRLGEPGVKDHCLFDGIPRTLAQAERLDDLLQRLGTQIDLAIEMSAPADALVGRILSRAKIEGRAEDNPQAIRQRMEIYNETAEPLLRYYAGRGILRSVDALGEPDEVFQRIRDCLGEQRFS